MMGDQLWMVREACVQLTDGKVTTRKVKLFIIHI